MKVVAISTIYNDVYKADKLFDIETCQLSDNILEPYIQLKNKFEDMGYECHTVDLLKGTEFEKIIFIDIPDDSLITINSFRGFLGYIKNRKWRKDYLLKSFFFKNINRYLIVCESPIACRSSYNKNYYKYFKKIFAWHDDYVDNNKVVKYFIPQTGNIETKMPSFYEKKLLTLIASNKSSDFPSELYSFRRKIIEFYEKNELGDSFDFYGFGWEDEGYKNYRGSVKQKIHTLSKYRFCICFENICDLKGYITEKIFDCFFAGCVPIYLGANNVSDYIPDNTYISMADFDTLEELDSFLMNMKEQEYEEYMFNIKEYLHGEQFMNTFHVSAFVNLISKNVGE